MPTPLTPDEEFDALFRQGLEHYPEQPENPAAWQRMDLLLDADLRQRALLRRVWRLLSAEAVLLVLGTWLVVHWAATRPTTPAVASAKATTAKQLTLPPAGRPSASVLAPPARGTAPTTPALSSGATPELSAASGSDAQQQARQPGGYDVELSSASSPAAPAAAAATRGAVVATTSNAQPVSAANSYLAALPTKSEQRAHSQNADHKYITGALLANSPRQKASVRALPHAEQPDLALQSDVVAASRSRQLNLHQDLASPTRRRSTKRVGVGQVDEPTAASATQVAQVARRQHAAGQRGAVALGATARRRRGPAATTPAASATGLSSMEEPSPSGALDFLAVRYPSGTVAALLPDSLTGVALAAWPRPADSLNQPKPVVAWQAYRLRLGVVASPELNSVRASRLTAPGGDLGLQLDYQLAQRWHLNAGYLLTLKRYVARGTDYNLPAGYALPHNWVISDVDAVCRIVDIPINLRYDVVRKKGYQLFASAGLSSLLMRREQYTYGYEPVAGKPVAPYTWELDNGSNHFLKILNLSAGYERAVGPRWTVQAEPYLKLPLGGVGFGTVRLMSAGVFFSFKYGLLPARPVTPAAP